MLYSTFHRRPIDSTAFTYSYCLKEGMAIVFVVPLFFSFFNSQAGFAALITNVSLIYFLGDDKLMSNFVTKIATIEIPVTNLKRAIEFYREVLSLEASYVGEKDAMLAFKERSMPKIYLVETKSNERLSFKNTHTGTNHSVIDFYTSSLEEFYHSLKERKIEVGTLNIDKESGFGGFGFKDPDGNLLGATNIV